MKKLTKEQKDYLFRYGMERDYNKKEQSFEEMFPSLKGKRYIEDQWGGEPSIDAYHEKDIKENCIEKQKVKAFIIELRRYYYMERDHYKITKETLDSMEKELGL
mgnify:FL=1